jgi:hypothetical protein
MIRQQPRFLFIVVPAVLALCGAAAAGAAGPLTLSQCLLDLNSCQSGLATCNAQLAQTQSDLGLCSEDLAQTESRRSSCAAELTAAQDGLAACVVDRDQLQTGLAACSSDLAACEEAAVAFPASGQTAAYPADKNDGITGSVAVPDDGTVQAGATLSYIDNGDGTITDNNTGLLWEKKSDDGGLHDKDNAYLWSGNGSQETVWDWLDDINTQGGTGFAGYNDWRLPNAKELQSIVNYQNPSPRVSVAFHSNCVPGATVFTGSCTFPLNYWSSTTRASSTDMAFYVSFNHGDVLPELKFQVFHVRAVRGGTP